MHKAKKKFGQNFLHDATVIERIIHAISLKETDNVIEIGPGMAALSDSLIKACNKLFLVEIDNDLIPQLKQRFSAYAQTRWHIFHQDALGFSFSSAEALLTEKTKFRVVGNLPYNISTPLLFHFIEQIEYVEDMHFMLQKEVVERICAKPDNKDYGRLSIMLQYFCDCEHLFDVAPESFEPAPKVESSIIRLTPYSEPPYPCKDTEELSKLVATAFSQRRKTIRNNFRKLGIEKEMEQANIDGSLRAENISLAQYVELCNILSNKGISI